MNKREYENAANAEIERAAADWIIKLDRGLSPEEQDEYMQWLAIDASHREAIKLYGWGWAELDRLSGLQSSRHAPIDPNLLEPGNRFSRAIRTRRMVKWGAVLLPMAAALTLVFYYDYAGYEGRGSNPEASETQTGEQVAPKFSRIEKLNLPDGSEVELNRGAIVETRYTERERRLRLVTGEANFKVAKDPSRPFVVEVTDVTLRALGTVFNVKADAEVVDLIVTEGRVKVETSEEEPGVDIESSVVTVGQRALVRKWQERPELEVFNIEEETLDEVLLWQPRMLDFDAVPLHRIVDEFNRRNSTKILVTDPEVRNLSLSCSFWSDNVEGFVRLMELSFDVKAEAVGEGVVLRRASGGRAAD